MNKEGFDYRLMKMVCKELFNKNVEDADFQAFSKSFDDEVKERILQDKIEGEARKNDSRSDK